MDEIRQGMTTVISAAAPYWAGEAEVVRTYFSRPRTRAQDFFWLRAQAYKEIRPLLVLPKQMQEEFWRTGTIHSHPDKAEAQRVEQEVKHFQLLAGLLAELSGTPVSPTDLEQLLEDRKLQELRAAYRKRGGELEWAAVAFTEGGGGAMFHVLSRLRGGEFEQKIAAIFQVIAEDEKFHGPMQIYALAGQARNASEWERARAIVQDISRQRLLMRNEMFGYPLPPARIEEIEAGKIEPWPIPISL